MGRIGLPELILIAVILLLLFGAKRLPSIAKSLGESIKEFKKGIFEKTARKKNNEDLLCRDTLSAHFEAQFPRFSLLFKNRFSDYTEVVLYYKNAGGLSKHTLVGISPSVKQVIMKGRRGRRLDEVNS